MDDNLIHIFINEKKGELLSDFVISIIEKEFNIKLVSKGKTVYLKDSYVYRFEYKISPRCFSEEGERIYIQLFEGIHNIISNHNILTNLKIS